MINLVREPGFNFIRPTRLYLLPIFLATSMFAIVAATMMAVMLYNYVSLGVKIDSERALLTRYEKLSSDIKLPENINSRIAKFREDIQKIEAININPVSQKMIFIALEKNKPNDVMYLKVEYNSVLSRCILEFTAIDNTSANKLLKALEEITIFRNITVMQKNRLGNQEKYLIELRI